MLHRPSRRNAKHAAQFISTLETYAFPRIGEVSVSDISTADILFILKPIWLSKSETARRVRQRIGTVLKWSIAQGYRQDNPADAILEALPKQNRTQKHRKAMPYQEVAHFIDTVRNSSAMIATKLAIEFLILTAARSGEVREAKWHEFDLVQKEWLVPAERMKANRPHRVPLSSADLTVLEDAKKLSDETGRVFPGTRFGKPLSDMTLVKLVKELGFDADIHGFRTSFKMWCQECTNEPREVSEAALAHVIKDRSEAAYARSDLFAKREKLMHAWAEFLQFDTDRSYERALKKLLSNLLKYINNFSLIGRDPRSTPTAPFQYVKNGHR